MMTRQLKHGTALVIGAAELMKGHDHEPELNGRALRGKVGEFMIWSRVLVDEELASLVQRNLPVQQPRKQ